MANFVTQMTGWTINYLFNVNFKLTIDVSQQMDNICGETSIVNVGVCEGNTPQFNYL